MLFACTFCLIIENLYGFELCIFVVSAFNSKFIFICCHNLFAGVHILKNMVHPRDKLQDNKWDLIMGTPI
jgi:hypothetical protein